jgi:hypothetical protein
MNNLFYDNNLRNVAVLWILLLRENENRIVCYDVSRTLKMRGT